MIMKKFMRDIGKVFVQGFITILPVALTFYIVYWFAMSAESLLGKIIRFVLPDNFYVPGIGIATGVLIILGVGILLRIWLFRKFFEWFEKALEKLPFIKFLYGAIRDLMDLFNASKKKDFEKVVMVSLGDNIRLMGLVTREDFSHIIKSDKMDKAGSRLFANELSDGGLYGFCTQGVGRACGHGHRRSNAVYTHRSRLS